MSAAFQFDDMLIAEDGQYALGIERVTGRHYIAVEIADDDLVGHDVQFEISEEEFMQLLDDPEGGRELARRCRAGEEQGRLFGGPSGPLPELT